MLPNIFMLRILNSITINVCKNGKQVNIENEILKSIQIVNLQYFHKNSTNVSYGIFFSIILNRYSHIKCSQ